LRRLPGDDLADPRAGAVLGELVPEATEMRLHHRTLARRRADAVIERPPATEAGGENLEGVRGARLDPDGLAYRRDRDRLAHDSPVVPARPARRMASADQLGVLRIGRALAGLEVALEAQEIEAPPRRRAGDVVGIGLEAAMRKQQRGDAVRRCQIEADGGA